MNTTVEGDRVSARLCTKPRMESVTFGVPGMVRLLHDLHQIRSPAPELAVPQQETLWANVPVDETGDSWAKRLLLIRT